MLLPIRTSITPSKTPYANYALIVANVVLFLITFLPHLDPQTGTPEILRPWAQPFMLTPARPFLWQFVTYAFLHGGLLHIIGNMFFLYIFGNNVNDKLGHIGYLCFYLAGAVFSAVGHSLLSPHPVLGASGAVAAVTGAYLVLFPQTLITVLYWFFVIGTMEVPALYFILIKLILIDNVIIAYTPEVAYDAHLTGYAFGVLSILLLLATGLMTSTHFDLWAMIRQWNRRRRYRDVVAAGYDPFTGLHERKRIKVKQTDKAPSSQSPEIEQLRRQITSRIAERNLAEAANLYLHLLDLDAKQILPKQHLLDIANQLASENRRRQAVEAYESFITHYASYEYIEQVRLMLGIIYSRYLDKPDLAAKHLTAAEQKLSDPAQLKMCRDELAKTKNL